MFLTQFLTNLTNLKNLSTGNHQLAHKVTITHYIVHSTTLNSTQYYTCVSVEIVEVISSAVGRSLHCTVSTRLEDAV
jgi:hypothetical protein